MNALVATKAKVCRLMVAERRRGSLMQAKKRRRQQINDFLVRVAGRVGR